MTRLLQVVGAGSSRTGTSPSHSLAFCPGCHDQPSRRITVSDLEPQRAAEARQPSHATESGQQSDLNSRAVGLAAALARSRWRWVGRQAPMSEFPRAQFSPERRSQERSPSSEPHEPGLHSFFVWQARGASRAHAVVGALRRGRGSPSSVTEPCLWGASGAGRTRAARPASSATIKTVTREGYHRISNQI